MKSKHGQGEKRGTRERIKGSGEDMGWGQLSNYRDNKMHKANGGWMMGAYVSIKIQQPSGRYQ